MRRLILLALSGALLVALATTAAFAQEEGEEQCFLPEGCPESPPGPDEPGSDEMFTGTEQSEVLFGTNGDDFIEGLGGHDYLNGLYGNDVLVGGEGDNLVVGEAGYDNILGGPGNDYLVAAYGYWQVAPDVPASPDFIQGGEGHDIVDAADRAGAPDDVRCGPGYDVVYADVEDYVTADCEEVYRY